MGMPQKLPHLPHPAVDWDTTKTNEHGKQFVRVACPVCRKADWQRACNVASRVRKGTFSGHCFAHRKITFRQRRAGYPPHPCVIWERKRLHITPRAGQRVNFVSVTCPKCHAERWGQASRIAQKIERSQFTGQCKACCRSAKKTVWVELSPGRKVDPHKGYVRLARHAVPEHQQHLWDGLAAKQRGANRIVFEHRFVMSVVLNRSLTSNELVDHMDGVKTNNAITNLRLYRRGKDEPGSGCGYGTYYHEWQMTLAELNRLKAANG